MRRNNTFHFGQANKTVKFNLDTEGSDIEKVKEDNNKKLNEEELEIKQTNKALIEKSSAISTPNNSFSLDANADSDLDSRYTFNKEPSELFSSVQNMDLNTKIIEELDEEQIEENEGEEMPEAVKTENQFIDQFKNKDESTSIKSYKTPASVSMSSRLSSSSDMGNIHKSIIFSYR